jgi:hypothetical protein
LKEEKLMTHHIAAYLLTLAVGYWVLTLAEKEKGLNKKIGKFVGWAILIVSLVGPLCLAASCLVCHSRGDACSTSSSCPWSGHGMMNGQGMGQGMMEDKAK